MGCVDPDSEALDQFRNQPQSGNPIVMLNLLRYREQAAYPDGFDAEPCSGREAYRRYGAVAGGLVANAGGRPVWMGTISGAFIAPDGESWDDAILVYYPSRQHFLDMYESADYQAVKPHRTAALEDSRLIESTALFGPGSKVRPAAEAPTC